MTQSTMHNAQCTTVAGRIILLFLTVHCAFCVASFAQDEVAPPPVKTVSKDERSRLDAKASDLKDRTRLALEMMDLRLDAAEKHVGERQFDAMFSQLGAFHALMDDSLEFLARNSARGGKVLDNYKRVELSLRSFSPRIETIRREIPVRYDDYVRKLMKFVREARTRATEPMFGDSVVRTKS